eukprot:5058756-Lingulodinium_polyedra.AAC.1
MAAAPKLLLDVLACRMEGSIRPDHPDGWLPDLSEEPSPGGQHPDGPVPVSLVGAEKRQGIFYSFHRGL